MSHNDYIRGNGVACWFSGTNVDGLTPTFYDYRRMDLLQYKALSTDGGSWTPTAPITIGGVGATLGASTLSGGLATKTGGRIILGTTSNEVPTISPARTRTILMPITDALQATAGTFNINGGYLLNYWTDGLLYRTPSSPFGASHSGNFYSTSLSIQFRIPKRYLHHGATLASAALNYRITNSSTPASPAAPASAYLPVMTVGGDSAMQVGWVPNGWNYAGYNGAGNNTNGATWAATTGYTAYASGAGQWVVPSSAKQNGFYYRCTTSGTSGGSEPTWPTSIGTATALDGTARWVCAGYSGQLAASQLGSWNAYYANGQPQSITWSSDTTSGFNNSVDVGTYEYVIRIANWNQYMLLHSIALTYSNIAQFVHE